MEELIGKSGRKPKLAGHNYIVAHVLQKSIIQLYVIDVTSRKKRQNRENP
ncbi:hypothetical protein RESH_03789 [Rhodopirellula europaea SH398]|uniref:Uncharacterized protein n=1 Tax=Rhodopirellula europaea SH398 TaxID=1263868 RepID=M5S286_9BACT|nr:hypothetical protein RESH_03789 [Rhodopirellula europaea SH398]